MKIAAISDIHVLPDGADDPLLRAIRERVLAIEPDVFVIAGDISHHIDVIEESLSKLRIENIANMYVPGNHDIWFEKEKKIGTLDKYSKVIGKVARKTGFHYLPDEPLEIGQIGFVGTIGWADYSFARADLAIPEEAYVRKEYNGAMWFDVFNLDWELSDKEATDLFNRKLEYDLSILSDEIKHVVYVSHHLPFKELTIYKNRLPWDFFSAYMGAVSTGQILLDDGRVILTISGHSHVRNLVHIDGITAITVPLGYGRPRDGNYEALARKAVAHVEIKNGSVEIGEFVKGDICEGLQYVMARK